MNKLFVVILFCGCLTLAGRIALADGSAAAGKEKSEDCATCHGEDGAGDGDTIPAIAGISAEDFKQAMAAYKDGTRTDSRMMVKMGKKLSPKDVADLAAYYATLEKQPQAVE